MSLPSSGQDSNWQVNSGINVFEEGSLSVVLLYEIMIGIEFDRFGFVYTYRS
jgi:hypothetical protein